MAMDFRDRFTRREYHYWIYLVLHPYAEGDPSLQEILSVIHNFADSLGDKAIVTVPAPGSFKATHDDVLSYPWPDAVRRELQAEMDPYLLILHAEITDFVPETSPFLILNLPSRVGTSRRDLEVVLFELETAIQNNDDVLEWQRNAELKKTATGMLQRILSAIELKPSVFGVSIDVRKLITGD